MGSEREHQRVKFRNPCILTWDRRGYLALLENLSYSGAFLKVANTHTEELLRIGDTVALKLCIDPNSRPTECMGTVIRIESSGLGVTFDKSEIYRDTSEHLKHEPQAIHWCY